MGRILRNLLASLLLPVALLAALLLALNTDPGRRLVTWGLAELSGGQIVPTGLSGTLPFAPRLERLELRDAQGTWLVIEDAALAIDAGRLLHGELAVKTLGAGRVAATRLPEPAQEPAGSIRLPFALSVARLDIRELDLVRALPGAPRIAIQGSGSVAGAGDGDLSLAIKALERTDRYRLQAAVVAGQYAAGLAIREGPGGLIQVLAHAVGVTLPYDVGTWRLDASAAGPPESLALNAMLDAGTLQAAADGVLDLDSRSLTRLRLSAGLPAMALERGAQPRISWQGIQADAELRGTLLAPAGSARVQALGLAIGPVSLDHLNAAGAGDGQRMRFGADIEGLRTPLDLPDTAMSVPLRVSGELRPTDPALPFQLGVRHPLLELAATGKLTGRSARAALSLPDLSAFSELAGKPLAGSAEIALAGEALDPAWFEATGEVRLTEAPGALPELLGPAARVAVSLRRDGPTWHIDAANVDGAGIATGIQGRVEAGSLDLGWHLDLPDLTLLAPDLSGRVRVLGGVAGPATALELVADLTADSGQDHLSGRVGARLSGPRAEIDLSGQWAAQPAVIQAEAGRLADGSLGLVLADVRWASVTAAGDLRLPPGAAPPQGEIRLTAERLSDLSPVISPLLAPNQAGPALAGQLDARLRVTDAGVALIQTEGEALRLPGAVQIGSLQLDARVTDPRGIARTEATLRLRGLEVDGIAGELNMTARGPVASLDLTLSSRLTTPLGPASLTTAAQLDGSARRVALQQLEARALDQTLRLSARAVVDLAGGLAIDRLRLNLGKGTIEVAGRVTPTLDLDATLIKLPLELARLAAPELPLAGSLDAQIRLSGSPDAPTGSVRAEASAVRLTEGAWRSMPAGLMTFSANLGPNATEIDARAEIGSRADLRVRGTIGGTPAAPGSLALKTDGRIDLTLLDPLLAGGGRQARGQTRLDASVTGTAAAPRLDGRLGLADGAFWDRRLGLALTEIEGNLRLAGDQIRVERFRARAGAGTLAVEGSVGLLAEGLPTDLRLVARNASPIQSDLVSVQGDADLLLQGRAAEALTASGTMHLSRVEVRLPERLPTAVAVLEVRESGSRARPPRTERGTAGSGLTPMLGLDLTLSAPRAVYIRGRGIDAELGGAVRVRGTLDAPELSGGFDLLRGQYDLVGQTLRFNRGRFGFDGAPGLNPNLDLEARVTAAGSTAILNVLGTATAPRIELRGEPELPEDEVLSRLLFGVAGSRLSGFQAARLGMAAAALAGVKTGEGLAVLDQARAGLGLDRLSIGTDEQGDAVLEGGRYLSERVYLGARQGTRAGETQGVLRIEVTPQIRLEADVGASGGTRGGGAFEKEY
jgi:translocation and assembly module TamB